MGTINTEVIEYKDLSDGIYVYLYLHVHVYLSVRLHHVNEVLRMVSCRFSNTHRPTCMYKRKYIQTCMRTYCIVEYTMQNCACILSLGPQHVGFQCPFTSSLGEFHAFGTGSGILGYCPCSVHRLFHSPFMYGCFLIHSFSPVIGFHSCFFFTTDVHVSATIRWTLHFLTF